MAIVLNQMGLFGVLLLIGFVATRIGLLNEKSLAGLSAFIVNVILPAMVVYMLVCNTDRQLIMTSGTAIAVMFCHAFFQYSCGTITGRLARLPDNTRHIHIFQYGQGNSGLVGLPLIIAVLGKDSSLYGSLFLLVDFTMLSTFGTYLSYDVSGDVKYSPRMVLSRLKNPMFIALVFSVVLVILNIRPSGFVEEGINGLSDSLRFVSMVYIGGMLATVGVKRIENLRGIVLIVVCKMLVSPVLIFWLTGFIPNIVPPPLRLALTLSASLPSAFTMASLAQENNSDYVYATLSTFITTVSCLVTIPTVCCIANMIA